MTTDEPFHTRQTWLHFIGGYEKASKPKQQRPVMPLLAGAPA